MPVYIDAFPRHIRSASRVPAQLKSNSYHAKRQHKQGCAPAPRIRRPRWVANDPARRSIAELQKMSAETFLFGAREAVWGLKDGSGGTTSDRNAARDITAYFALQNQAATA
jgi:hypothetical protein